jgi:hypothetical protein
MGFPFTVSILGPLVGKYDATGMVCAAHDENRSSI